MKKQYGNYIEIVPVHGVTSVDDNSITLKSGYSMDRLDTLSAVEPEEQPENTGAGTLYKFTLEVGVDKLSDTLRERYWGSIPVILKLIAADTHEETVVGSVRNPVRLTYTPNTEYDSFSFSRSSVFPVL
ncbi:MAG: hypothetical protein ACOC59_00260 [Bacteroidota bacterium]